MKTIYNEMCLIQITMANAVMIVLLYVILMVTLRYENVDVLF